MELGSSLLHSKNSLQVRIENFLQMASAKASAEKLTEKSITAAMRDMNRPDLLEMLHLPFDTKMVCDIDGLHPVTLYQKSTLAIESWKVPFLNKGAAGKCCTGAFIARFGHKTVALKCFETELTSRSSVCAHCEELWAMSSDDMFTQWSKA